MFKTTFCFEKYRDFIMNDKFRNSLISFRVSAHDLEIERGGYNNIPRNLRTCKLCNMQAVESEFHFLLTCPVYRQLRQQYIGSSSWATIEKFTSLMTVSSRRLLNLSKLYIWPIVIAWQLLPTSLTLDKIIHTYSYRLYIHLIVFCGHFVMS